MNVLMIVHAAPFPPEAGTTKRIFHILEQVAKRHNVTLLALGTEAEERAFKESAPIKCKEVYFVNNRGPMFLRFIKSIWYLATGRSLARHYYNRKLQSILDSLLTQQKFDLIHCSTTLLGYYRLPNGTPKIGDTQNVEYDNAYRAFKETGFGIRKFIYFLEFKSLLREELANCRKFQILLTTSERDRSLLRENLPDIRMQVIPNGVDLAAFTPRSESPEPKSLVFTGLMNYYPNDHGAIFFLDEIFPLILEKEPGALIYIVGSNPSRNVLKRASDRIIVTGYVADVRPYISRSQIFVIPLRMGGGTRLKALEAMAMKKPIVSTTLGCEGIEVQHGHSVLLADSPRDFAAEVVRLLGDESLRISLASNAFKIAADLYGWDGIGKKLETLYQAETNGNPGMISEDVGSKRRTRQS